VRRSGRRLGGVDVVVETVGGHADTLGQALQLVAINGRISVLGAFTQPVQLHPIMLFLKEPTIVGSNCYGRPGKLSDYEMSIEIMRRCADSSLIASRSTMSRRPTPPPTTRRAVRSR
jgi:threonine dehydrogenase-like Zn-dependent dehydrogenase